MIISLDNIAHIKNRHGELYEKYKDQLPEIINNPDYVFDARVPNRALAVKKYQESLAVVLELSFENPKFSNKIVTMWEVTDKELLKLEQKRILMYKKT